MPVKRCPAQGENLSPPSDPRMERADSREVRNPKRAGSPETGHADPFTPRSPEAQAGRDVTPPKGERAGLVTTSEDPVEWGESSEGENPRKASTTGWLRPTGDCTDSPREESLEGGCGARLSSRRVGPRQRQEGRGSERSTHRVRGEGLGGRSPWTLRRFGVGRRRGEWP